MVRFFEYREDEDGSQHYLLDDQEVSLDDYFVAIRDANLLTQAGYNPQSPGTKSIVPHRILVPAQEHP